MTALGILFKVERLESAVLALQRDDEQKVGEDDGNDCADECHSSAQAEEALMTCPTCLTPSPGPICASCRAHQTRRRAFEEERR